MIDYASITPMMSMTTFIAGFISVLIIGASLIEISEGMAEKRRKKLGAEEMLTPSQRAVKRYYDEKGADNNGN